MESADIVICFVNALSSVVSILSNAMVFVAIFKTPSLHTPTNILLCSLAASDFAVGFVVQPTLMAIILTDYNKPVYKFFEYCFIFLFAFSLSTVTLVTVDRFLALHWHLRYYSKVTVKRVAVALSMVWFVCIVCTVVYHEAGGRDHKFRFSLASLICILTPIVYCHYKTFKIIRLHRRRIAAQRQAFPIPLAKQGRSIKTVWYIQGLYIICIAPFVWSRFARAYLYHGESLRTLKNFCRTFLFLNSTLNPFLYGYRSREIRRVILKMMKRFTRSNKITLLRPDAHMEQLQIRIEVSTIKSTRSRMSDYKVSS